MSAQKSKHNYRYLYDVYKKLCETEPGTSVSEFARAHGIQEGACREAFRRIEKKNSRTEKTRTNGPAPSIFEAGQIVQQICKLAEMQLRVLTILLRSLIRLDHRSPETLEMDEKDPNEI